MISPIAQFIPIEPNAAPKPLMSEPAFLAMEEKEKVALPLLIIHS